MLRSALCCCPVHLITVCDAQAVRCTHAHLLLFSPSANGQEAAAPSPSSTDANLYSRSASRRLTASFSLRNQDRIVDRSRAGRTHWTGRISGYSFIWFWIQNKESRSLHRAGARFFLDMVNNREHGQEKLYELASWKSYGDMFFTREFDEHLFK